jgi:hypothetical protein
MKRSNARFAIVLAVSMLIGIQAVEVIDANPFTLWKKTDTPPDAIPPIISVTSPQNSSIYPSTFNINFTINKPQCGEYDSSIIKVSYTIDNVTVRPYSIWSSNTDGIPQFETVFKEPSLSEGNHTLIVEAEGVVYLPNFQLFFENSTTIVFFTVHNQTFVNYLFNQIVLTPIVIIIIVAVTSVSLVYFKKHKPNTELDKKS